MSLSHRLNFDTQYPCSFFYCDKFFFAFFSFYLLFFCFWFFNKLFFHSALLFIFYIPFPFTFLVSSYFSFLPLWYIHGLLFHLWYLLWWSCLEYSRLAIFCTYNCVLFITHMLPCLWYAIYCITSYKYYWFSLNTQKVFLIIFLQFSIQKPATLAPAC